MDDSGPSLAYLFPVIRCPKAPSTADISRLEALGLACANFHDYFQFNHDWDFPQLDGVLRSLFPTLFEYLDTQEKATNYSYSSSKQDACYKYLPPYHLCVKSCRDVAIASGVDFLTGEVIYTKWKSCTATKGAGKRKAVYISDSDTDDSEFDAPVSAPRHPSKRLRITDGADAIPVTPPMSLSIIDLSGDTVMGATAGTPPLAESPVTIPAPTAPLTPAPGSPVQPPGNSTGSFVIDGSIADPWRANRTFHF
ncbi:hypothetical protein EDC04DRAFT_2616343 [Pisolithus marmoratus]|nr:hypothetical protein EDC04DRAFT_2616343 [Pisolithus marmoratus]